MKKANRRKRRRVRKGKNRGYLWILILLVLLAAAASAGAQTGISLRQEEGVRTTGGNTGKNSRINVDTEDWKLILVNKDHPLPDNYNTEQVQLYNGESVDSRIYPELQQMIDEAKKEGVYAFIVSGYRTEEKQESIMQEKIDSYLLQGYSGEKAKEIAGTWVAVPGTSEHQTGLAVDINADTSQSSSDEVYSWLYENAYRYGFILRYPQEKEKITGTNYEPWHYRYVGKEAAEEIYESGTCLEEYIKDRKQ